MLKVWCINYGVNRSHATETFSDENGKVLFDKKKDIMKCWNEIDIKKYRSLGFNYLSLVSLVFENNKFATCKDRKIIKEKSF